MGRPPGDRCLVRLGNVEALTTTGRDERGRGVTPEEGHPQTGGRPLQGIENDGNNSKHTDASETGTDRVTSVHHHFFPLHPRSAVLILGSRRVRSPDERDAVGSLAGSWLVRPSWGGSKPKKNSGMRILSAPTLQPCTDPRTPKICRPGSPKIPSRNRQGGRTAGPGARDAARLSDRCCSSQGKCWRAGLKCSALHRCTCALR
jgi:hypothetical protein